MRLLGRRRRGKWRRPLRARPCSRAQDRRWLPRQQPPSRRQAGFSANAPPQRHRPAPAGSIDSSSRRTSLPPFCLLPSPHVCFLFLFLLLLFAALVFHSRQRSVVLQHTSCLFDLTLLPGAPPWSCASRPRSCTSHRCLGHFVAPQALRFTPLPMSLCRPRRCTSRHCLCHFVAPGAAPHATAYVTLPPPGAAFHAAAHVTLSPQALHLTPLPMSLCRPRRCASRRCPCHFAAPRRCVSRPRACT